MHMNTQDAKFEELGRFKHGGNAAQEELKSVNLAYTCTYIHISCSTILNCKRVRDVGACARVLSPIVPFSKYSSIIPGVVQITRVNLFEYIAERR